MQKRLAFLPLLAAVSLTLGACGSKSTSGEVPEIADGDSGAVNVTLGGGSSITTPTTQCTVDGKSGKVLADESEFALEFTDGKGTVSWVTPDGSYEDQDASVEVDGKVVTTSGSTSEGKKYDVTANCA